MFITIYISCNRRKVKNWWRFFLAASDRSLALHLLLFCFSSPFSCNELISHRFTTLFQVKLNFTQIVLIHFANMIEFVSLGMATRLGNCWPYCCLFIANLPALIVSFLIRLQKFLFLLLERSMLLILTSKDSFSCPFLSFTSIVDLHGPVRDVLAIIEASLMRIWWYHWRLQITLIHTDTDIVNLNRLLLHLSW